MRPPGRLGPGNRVVCVGDVLLDICALLPGPLVQGSDTPAPVSYLPGGSAANTAAWLASLGVPCLFAGRVGDDAFGRDAVAALHRHGVQTRVSADPVTPTGACLVLIGPDGERTMVPSAGANATLSPADLGSDLLRAGDHLHLSGYTLLNEGSRAAGRYALDLAGTVGASVSVDAASAGPIRTSGAERFLAWLPSGALLLANTDELAALSDDRPDRPAELAAAGLTLVVKDGPHGARLIEADGCQVVPTTPVPARDSTGAGDAFAAGLLAAWLTGNDLLAAIRAGHRTGALAVGRLGARPSRGVSDN